MTVAAVVAAAVAAGRAGTTSNTGTRWRRLHGRLQSRFHPLEPANGSSRGPLMPMNQANPTT